MISIRIQQTIFLVKFINKLLMSSPQISEFEFSQIKEQKEDKRHIYRIFELIDTQLTKVISQFLENYRHQYDFANNTKFTPISLYQDLFMLSYIKTLEPQIQSKSTKEINNIMKDCYEKLAVSTQRSFATIKDRINKKLWRVSKQQILNSVLFKRSLKFDKKQKPGQNYASKKGSKQKTVKSSQKKRINDNYISLDSSDDNYQNNIVQKQNQTPVSTKPASSETNQIIQNKNKPIEKHYQHNNIIQQQLNQQIIQYPELPNIQVAATNLIEKNKDEQKDGLFKTINHGLSYTAINEETLDDIIFICIDNTIVCCSKQSVEKSSEKSLQQVRILAIEKKQREQRQKKQRQQREERQRKQQQQRQRKQRQQKEQRQRKQLQSRKQQQRLLNRQKIAENLQRYEDKFDAKFKHVQPMDIEAPGLNSNNSSKSGKARNVFPIEKVPSNHKDQFMKMFEHRKQEKLAKNIQQQELNKNENRQQTLNQFTDKNTNNNFANEQQKALDRIYIIEPSLEQRNKEWEKIRQSADLRDALRKKSEIGKFRRSSQFAYKNAFDKIRSEEFLRQKQQVQTEQQQQYNIKPVLVLNREQAQKFIEKANLQENRKVITIDDQSADMEFQKPRSIKKTVTKYKRGSHSKNILNQKINQQFTRKQDSDNDDIADNLIGLRPSPTNELLRQMHLETQKSQLCKQQQDILLQSVNNWKNSQVMLKLLIRHNPNLTLQVLLSEYKLLGVIPPKEIARLYI